MHYKDSALLVLFISMNVFSSMSLMRTGSAADPVSPCAYKRPLREVYCIRVGLTSVPEDLPYDAEIFYLWGNEITALYSTSFFSYKQLHVINLRYNNISFIASGTFSMLSFLQNLDLSVNRFLPVLRADMFGSTALRNIELRYCSLGHFEIGFLSAITRTLSLNLMGNDLEYVNWTNCHNVTLSFVSLSRNKFTELSEQSFLMDCRVEFLDLSNNPISLVSPATISTLKVRSLNMSNARLPEKELHHLFESLRSSSTIASVHIRNIGLTSLRPGLFDTTFGEQLKVLDLATNELQLLIPRGFENLTRICELNLGYNNLKVIKPNYFSGMSELRVLHLRNNEISAINLNSDKWNVSLTHLYLQENQFEQIGTQTFRGLESLEVLDLSGNNLMPASHNLLSDLEFLNTLKFSDCYFGGVLQLNMPSLKILDFFRAKRIPIGMVSPGVFQRNTPLLQKIDFAEADIEATNFWNYTEGASSFQGLHDLHVLNLTYIELMFTPPSFFKDLSNLTDLILNNAKVEDLPGTLLYGLFSLQTLELRQNRLRFIPKGFFMDTVQLQRLFLDENRLQSLDGNLFQYVENLTFLKLSDNDLVMLDHNIFEPVQKTLLTLFLERNPWNCNCSLKWLPKWIKAKSDCYFPDTPMCAYTGSLKSAAGKPLIDFDPGRECGTPIILYSSVAASALCTTIGLILVYYNRWKIRYGFFLCKIHFIGYREIVPQQQREDFKFDMYVIFHDEEEEWTEEIFRRGLEENLPGYARIAIGDEALRLGMYYLDSVSLLVENSFKVVFLISANALKNHMFLLKFRIALDYVNEAQVEKIVLVFLEEIPDADLPFLIRLFLSDNRAYLMWPRDPEGQPYFWEKLGKYMTVNRCCNPLVPP
ncbi:toll-like receptor 8 [Diadema setosum]|uniref:toll-like receptor 8 n=1 Tax=Diadema setosum TaxID=31175 RepID=UPI003B3B70AB